MSLTFKEGAVDGRQASIIKGALCFRQVMLCADSFILLLCVGLFLGVSFVYIFSYSTGFLLRQ